MRKNYPIGLTALLCILVFAALVRSFTFQLPHDNGDQVFYLGLAMKLDKFGFGGYTLRNIDVGGIVSETGVKQVLGLYPTEKEQGTLLLGLARTGVTYYDEPLFHRSYGFPYALMFSHRIFSREDPYLALYTSGRHPNGYVYSLNSRQTWPLQFYAAFVPFIFSLLFILCTYILGKRLFSRNVAIMAAFLVAISPIEILSSQKTWADTMLSFFVVFSLLLFYMAKERHNPVLSFSAGLSCGIAVLVKQTGGFLVIALLIFHILQHRDDLFNPRKWAGIIFDRHIMLFCAGVAVATFHWFYSITKTYGNPLYSAPHSGLDKEVGWFAMLGGRPRFLYLISIPCMVPLFGLAYFSVIAGPFIKGFMDDRKTLLSIWILTFLCILIYMNTKENRYMLPAYPAIAILTADILQRIGDLLNNRLGRNLGTVLIVAALLASAFWAVPMGIKHALYNVALILKPF
ncbi:MAG: glycosyltransferase family 39 protein [Candidatus Omnitrophica bacterium]|nr:glycosyltransferase family 39 protein [Candidatus Omnitrophota bacterium]